MVETASGKGRALKIYNCKCAKKVVAGLLSKAGLPTYRLTARTGYVGREEWPKVTIHGWQRKLDMKNEKYTHIETEARKAGYMIEAVA